ncbi:MAG: hypothetical protein BYD32DRAFT_441146 [Podila humilis]|nr:MAG: hypothetical protein BYD32DRAFT_441146 [Podila humilis]
MTRRRSSIVNIQSALWLVSAIWALNEHVAASVISASKASSTNFELQTNIVSCGIESSGGGSTAAAVCSQPESKLFSNIKVVNGTPYPGPTGVRGRLYDVGTLCQDNVSEKIDRAWVAFLDCSGCPISTKLANLQNSNPQAILLYNQTACVFPAPVVPPAPETSSLVDPPQATSVAPTPTAPATSAPVVTTTQPPAPVTTPSEANHNGGNDGGDGGDENDEERTDHLKRELRTLLRRQLLGRVAPGLVKRGHHIISTSSYEEPYIDSSTTIAMAEQVTIDYLFQVLQGPASNAPLPGALRSIKTIHHSSIFRVLDDSNGDAEAGGDKAAPAPAPSPSPTPSPSPAPSPAPAPAPATPANPANAITDLMVSISPSYGESGSGDKKFLSMSKPIFATVVGLLSAVVCGVILLYVVRPLIRRGRRKTRDSDMEEMPATPAEYSKEQGPGDDSNNSGISGGIYSANSRSASNVEQIEEPTEIYLTKQSHEWNRSQNNLVANTSQEFENSIQPNIINKVDADDEQNTQKHLQQLRQQERGLVAPPQDIAPASHNVDEPRWGLPVWRQTDVPVTAPAITEAQEIIASYNAKQLLPQSDIPVQVTTTEASKAPTIDTRVALTQDVPATLTGSTHHEAVSATTASTTSARNGSCLFEGTERRTPNTVSFPGPLPPINTSNLSREGGLASALRRQRLSVDASTPHSLYHSSQSPHATLQGSMHSSSVATPGRVSFSDDLVSARTSMDSHRKDVQQRPNDLTFSSRSGGTPRASFSDDFGPASGGRKSLDSSRLPMPALVSVPTTPTEKGGGVSEMDAYKAYKSSRRDPSSGI